MAKPNVRNGGMVMEELNRIPCAERLGIDQKTLDGLVRNGVISCGGRPGKRTFPWPKVRHEYDQYIKDKARDAGDKSKLEVERDELKMRKERAEARMAELKLEELEGKLIPVHVHEQEVEGMMRHFRSILLAHPKTRDHADELLKDFQQQPPPVKDVLEEEEEDASL